MTKKRILIYLICFFVLLISLFVCIFTLIKNKDPIKSEASEITPIPLIDITWPQAVDLIQNCQIKTVFQKRSLEVTLTSKDNQIFKTKEPKFNDIFEETNHLRSDCNDIIQTISE